MSEENNIITPIIGCISKGKVAVATGYNTEAHGDYSHAEGISTKTGGFDNLTRTFWSDEGRAAHAEGEGTVALGWASHSEGMGTTAYGDYSHAEGYYTKTGKVNETGTQIEEIGWYAHSEGMFTTAAHTASHAEGCQTQTGANYQTVLGKYNIGKKDTIFEVGIGQTEDNRKNAFEVYLDGHAELQSVGDTPKAVLTREFLANIFTNRVIKVKELEYILDINDYYSFELNHLFSEVPVTLTLVFKYLTTDNREEELIWSESITPKSIFNLKYINGYFRLISQETDLSIPSIKLSKAAKQLKLVVIKPSALDINKQIIFDFKGQKEI